MDNNEQTQNERTTPKEAADNTSKGNEPQTDNILDRADLIAKRLEEANKKAEELVKRHEAVAARMLLAGRTEAGSVGKSPKELEEEEVAKEAQKIVDRFKTH